MGVRVLVDIGRLVGIGELIKRCFFVRFFFCNVFLDVLKFFMMVIGNIILIIGYYGFKF